MMRLPRATTSALVWLTTACGQVTRDVGVTRADPRAATDASVADSGSEPPVPYCDPDAGSAPHVIERIHYFINYQTSENPKQLPCGIYTFVYDGPATRTDPGNARVLFEHAGTVLFTVEYDWRTQVPDLSGPPFVLDFDGYFTLTVNSADAAMTDLWNLRYNFDGRHIVKQP